jgi:sialidase-1
MFFQQKMKIVMRRRSFLFPVYFSVIILSSPGVSAETVPPGQITAISQVTVMPVLKGVSTNPVLRVIVSIPAGYSAQRYQKLQCSLKNFKDVDKVDVYLTGAEPFSASDSVTSFRPLSNTFDVPVNVSFQPGIKFIWLSVILKAGASINDKIELHCNRMIDEKGKSLVIKEESPSYVKRLGIAIRRGGEDGVNTYRIPGIVQTDKRTLIAVYDVRYNNSGDLPGYINLGMSRSNDGGETWQPMKVIMSMGGPNDNSGVGDPSILFDETTKTIWVAALWSKGNRSIAGSIGGLSPDSTGQLLLVKSGDDGNTWSSPINITPQVKNPSWKILFQGPGRGIMMKDGKLIFPAQYWDSSNMPYSTIVYSDDHGNTWKGKTVGPKSNTTESQVIETMPRMLMLNMRDNRGSYRSVATSDNMGATWTEHSTSYNALPDPVCMGSLIKARVKVKGVMRDVLFFSNPATKSGRYNMAVKASLDFGQTWLDQNQLLIDERNCYGYSCLTKVDDNTIGLLYEGVKDLYFVKIAVSDIIK